MAIPPNDRTRQMLVSMYGKDSEKVRSYDRSKGYVSAPAQRGRPTPTTGPRKKPGPFKGSVPSDNPLNPASPGDFLSNLKNNQSSVKAMQQFLINQGYDIGKVDGISGPLTQSAIDDWHKGVGVRNPKSWSNRYGTGSSIVQLGTDGKPKPVPPALKDAAPSGPGPQQPPDRSPAAAPTSAPSSSGGITDLLKALGVGPGAGNDPLTQLLQPIKPKELNVNDIVSTLSAGYDPAMKQAQTLIDEATKNAGDNQTFIGHMFDTLVNRNNNARSQYNADQGSANMGDIGAAGQAAVSSIQGANDSFLGNMSDVLNLYREQQGLEQRKADQGNINDLKQALVDLTLQKAQSGAGAKLDALKYNNTLDNQTNSDNWTRLLQASQFGQQRKSSDITNLATLSMLPGQLDAQSLQNIMAGKQVQGADIANTRQALQAQGDALNLKKLQQVLNSGGADWTDRNFIGQVTGSLSGALGIGPHGGFTQRPDTALKNGLLALQTLGLAKQPKAKAILYDTFQRALNTAHSHGQYRGVTFRNGKVYFATPTDS